MDINTNISQQSVAAVMPLKAMGGKQSTDSPVSAVAGAKGREEIRLASDKASGDAEVKIAKKEDDGLQQAVEQLNDYVQNVQRNLQFSVDKDSGTMVVKVIDSKTETVIRQIPTEETLKLARHLSEDKQDKSFNIFSSRA